MVSAEQTAEAPNWNLTSIFPSLESPEYTTEFSKLRGQISELEIRLKANDIGREALADLPLVKSILEDANEMIRCLRLLRSYVSAKVTTNTEDAASLAKASELDPLSSRVNKIIKTITAWLGGIDFPAELPELVEYRYFFEKAKIEAIHLLPTLEEEIVSDLEITGSMSWTKLHSNVTSQIQVQFELDGEVRTLAMSEVRNLSSHPDRATRQKAYSAELQAWERWQVPLAAAMNAIKGETVTLAARRGWSSPLEAALFASNIDPQTLEAMQTAIRDSMPSFRRYLHAKAKKMGVERLGFYDLFAPIPGGSRLWDWQEAESFVIDQFEGYSTKLADFARRAFAEKWVDYPSRRGKVDGAYCMRVRADESRILMNFKPSFSALSTLAHELGHGYHNLCLAHRPELLRTSPMTLAETASIFCETVVRKAYIQSASGSDKLAVLDASLLGSCQVVVDIHSRFIFESEVFRARPKRELSSQEMCEAMLAAQKETYGDGLNSNELHPYMWAAKPHYYGRSFYNFPYTFGLLFALGLYQVYQAEGASFHPRYDDLLSSTSMASAGDLADRFGINIRTPSFWEGSLNQIKSDIHLYESIGPDTDS